MGVPDGVPVDVAVGVGVPVWVLVSDRDVVRLLEGKSALALSEGLMLADVPGARVRVRELVRVTVRDSLRGGLSLGLNDALPLSEGLALPLTHSVPLGLGDGSGDGVGGGGSHFHEKPYGVPGATSPYTASAMLNRLPAYSAE